MLFCGTESVTTASPPVIDHTNESHVFPIYTHRLFSSVALPPLPPARDCLFSCLPLPPGLICLLLCASLLFLPSSCFSGWSWAFHFFLADRDSGCPCCAPSPPPPFLSSLPPPPQRSPRLYLRPRSPLIGPRPGQAPPPAVISLPLRQRSVRTVFVVSGDGRTQRSASSAPPWTLLRNRRSLASASASTASSGGTPLPPGPRRRRRRRTRTRPGSEPSRSSS